MNQKTMNYWLVKSEPAAYSWQQFEADGKTRWDGVRNYQARNNIQSMQKDDLVLFYHSVTEKQVMGIARVVKTAYPDPTANDDRWVVVDMVPEEKLPNPVSLAVIKADVRLEQVALVKQARLSVMPLKPEEFDAILELGNPESQLKT